VYRHNFQQSLEEHQSVQRVYALNDEAGLLLCTWPIGGRPAYPFPYADEVWTGIEYQVAAELIYQGCVAEGLQMVRAVRSRHDGSKRNPWNEPECGHHYARAMSSWSLLLALSGYHYDAVSGLLRIVPREPSDTFRSFFSAGTAWGVVALTQRDDKLQACFDCLWGSFGLAVLELPFDGRNTVHVTVGGTPVASTFVEGRLRFDPPLVLREGQQLLVQAQ